MLLSEISDNVGLIRHLIHSLHMTAFELPPVAEMRHPKKSSSQPKAIIRPDFINKTMICLNPFPPMELINRTPDGAQTVVDSSFFETFNIESRKLSDILCSPLSI
jgi:hypothetical protein